jgi:hypothetical protein
MVHNYSGTSWRSVRLDETRRCRLTTVDGSAVQSLVDFGELVELDRNSDRARRERIGNTVPPCEVVAMDWRYPTVVPMALPTGGAANLCLPVGFYCEVWQKGGRAPWNCVQVREAKR